VEGMEVVVTASLRAQSLDELLRRPRSELAHRFK
jgi:hypothetical protein